MDGFDQAPNFANMQALNTTTNSVSLVIFLMFSYWLYLIAKKLNEDYPWLAFVPLVQVYTLLKVAKKWLIWILWFILAYILVWGSMGVAMIFAFTKGPMIVPAFIWIIWMIWLFTLIIKLIHSISTRCWRWVLTTIWFIFIPALMFLIVWLQMQ